MKFSFKDLVRFTDEILNGKLLFLCSEKFNQKFNLNLKANKPSKEAILSLNFINFQLITYCLFLLFTA